MLSQDPQARQQTGAAAKTRQFSLWTLLIGLTAWGIILGLSIAMGPFWHGALMFWTGAALAWGDVVSNRPLLMIAGMSLSAAGVFVAAICAAP